VPDSKEEKIKRTEGVRINGHRMLRRVASRLVFGFVISVYLTLCVISSNPFDPGGGGEQENQDANVVISPKQCTQNEEGVILVHSFAGNFELRSSQRNAKKELGAEELKFVFVLFYSDDVNMDLVSKESNMYSDILLGDREESYKGLVYKHLMGLKWVDKNCSKVTRVIKMDDDISIDFPRLISTAERSLPTTSPLYMAGLLQITLPILRSRLSKWGVSEVEMPGTTYPDFLSGWCYLTTPATIRAVLAVYQEGQAVFWIDDVWVTGILGAKAKVKLISLNLYYTVYRWEQLKYPH
jgi:hypothetical protein